MRDLCDVTFTVLVERIEVQVAAAQQAAMVARALGSKVEVPMLDDAIDSFAALVAQEPVVIDSAERELRQALGLRVA